MMVQELLSEKNSVVVTVSSTTTLVEAARTMVDHRIGALVVTDDAERLLGIISERDLTKAIADHAAGVVEQRVGNVMSHPVVTMLAGMISIRDVTGKWIELLEEENR